jgi:hypothetical protein
MGGAYEGCPNEIENLKAIWRWLFGAKTRQLVEFGLKK